MDLGGRQLVVAEVKLRQGEEKRQVVPADLGYRVVEEHQRFSSSRQASGNALQQVVVHVESVELLQTLVKIKDMYPLKLQYVLDITSSML